MLLKGWQEGVLPQWNPYTLMGVPFIANLKYSFYAPLNLLILPLNKENIFHVVSLQVYFHYPLALAFSYIFLRSLAFTRYQAFIFSLVYTLCGLNLSTAYMTNLLSVMYSLPLFAYLIVRYHKSPFAFFSWPTLALLFAVASPLLASSPVFTYLFCLALVVFCCFRFSYVNVIRLISFGALLLGASAAILVPGVDLILEFSEMIAKKRELANSFASFHPVRFIEFFMPHPFGTFSPQYTYWGHKYAASITGAPMYLSYYLSALALPGLAIFFSKIKKQHWPLMLGICVSLVIAMKDYFVFDFYAVLQEVIPFFGMFRYSAKLMVLFCFFSLVAMALGWRHALSRNISLPIYYCWQTVLTITTVGMYYYLTSKNEQNFVSQSLIYFLAMQVILTVMISFYHLRILREKVVLGLLFLLTLTDLSLHANAIIWPQYRDITRSLVAEEIHADMRENRKEILQGRSIRYSSILANPEEIVIFKIENEEINFVGLRTVSSVVRILPDLPLIYEVYDAQGRGMLGVMPNSDTLQKLYRIDPKKTFNLSGVYYILNAPKKGEFRFKVNANRQAAPYFYSPDKIILSPRPALEILAKQSFNAQTDVYIPATKEDVLQNSSFTLKQKFRNTQSLHLDAKRTKNNETNFILVNENFHKYWRAFVNEKKVNITKANSFAILINLGENCNEACSIRLEYNNPLIMLGIYISLGTLLLFISFILLRMRTGWGW